MNTLLHFSQNLAASNVDAVNGVVRDVSVITAGPARGHDLEVDEITLRQMLDCAKAKSQVPVKVDHGTGAGAVCGFLENFEIKGRKLKADWFLLSSHPATAQIIEVAERMPSGCGLSVAFINSDTAEPGRARCEELISVDYVASPGANPTGLFSHCDVERPSIASAKVKRVLEGAYHRKPDRSLDLASRVNTILLERRDSLTKITDATARNVSVPIPYADQVDQAQTAIRYAKKPLVRRIAIKAAKVISGATLGHVVEKHYGAKAGVLTGGLAGLLFESAEVRGNIRLSLRYAKRVMNL